MKIQTRDKEILSTVFKYGILSTEQIGEIHFKNLHHTTLMRRLKILEKERLILNGFTTKQSECLEFRGSRGKNLKSGSTLAVHQSQHYVT